jgi:hypothetical protein
MLGSSMGEASEFEVRITSILSQPRARLALGTHGITS